VWENPEGFDPERFAADKQAEMVNFSYFPFGGGPRFCIGQNFALTEGVLALATLAQRYEVSLVPGRRVQIANAVTLRPEGGLQVTLKRRDVRLSSAAQG
jgi:cytochrome P450